MHTSVNRQTADLSAYPDLVVIYLGMKAKSLRGVWRLLTFGPKLQRAAQPPPDGLLRNENFFWSLFPLHGGIRQYWRDFDSLERWARSLPHQEWWQDFLRDNGGTAFWHETYFMRGGMESIFDDLDAPFGFTAFAPTHAARGAMFSARRRMRIQGEETAKMPLSENELYAEDAPRT